ncbi:chromatin associated protein KTI12-domain-containing protein [Aspergillus carlsbadensis]|nr:chromatin associated protein KTI12-domain-containing protein [Aspergillus carlsbadensis]
MPQAAASDFPASARVRRMTSRQNVAVGHSAMPTFKRYHNHLSPCPLPFASTADLSSGALAQRDCGPLVPTISSEDDIDALAESCESLDGVVDIDRNLTGPFVLPNIVNMSTAWLSGTGGEYGDPFGITSFEMPDLEEADWINLKSLDDLEKWSTPRLAIAENIDLHIPAHLPSLEFPALERVRGIDFYGNLSEVSLDALRRVEHILWIANTPNSLYPPVIETTMNISLPRLESTSSVTFRGKIFSIPELTTIKPYEDTDSNSWFIQNGTGISIDFPKLDTIHGDIWFQGNISSISFPQLRNVTGSIRINAGDSLSLSMPLLENANIHISGNIERVEVPNLRNFTDIRVYSDLYLDCDELTGNLNKTNPDGLPGEVICMSEQTLADTIARGDDRDAAVLLSSGGVGVIIASAVAALIILTGYPCSGLTHRALQIAAGLEEAQSTLFETGAIPSTKPRYKINIVSTHDNVNYPRTVYDTARTEKEARGLAYTRGKRALGRDSFVILDGMNYIKGYRYQLWCEAKALGTTCCVVHVGTPIEQCVANNEARIRRKESQSQPKSDSQTNENKDPSPSGEPTTEQPPNPPATEEGESDPYPPDLLNNLIFRYEEPSMHSRWDKPLFTVPYSDTTPPIADIWTALTGLPHPSTLTQPPDEEPSAVSQLTTALNSTSLSSAASTATGVTMTQGGTRSALSRPRVAIKPHQATVLPASTDSSALYSMEKRTSAIIQAIRSYTLSNPSAKAALASQPPPEPHPSDDDDDTFTRQEPGIRITVPDSTIPIFVPEHIASASVTDDLAAAGGILALPRLQRLRRQWITLNRAYIAGPHAAVKGGALKEADVPDAFVRFLNADFADEVEER